MMHGTSIREESRESGYDVRDTCVRASVCPLSGEPVAQRGVHEYMTLIIDTCSVVVEGFTMWSRPSSCQQSSAVFVSLPFHIIRHSRCYCRKKRRLAD